MKTIYFMRGVKTVSPWKNNRITPAQIVIAGFLLLILCGAALLTLPFATRDGAGASFGDALFTATSATCVTGLVIHDTYTYWSAFGQLVILVLIQIGGMGVVTMAMAISMFTGRRIGLKQRFVLQESMAAPQMGGVVRMTGFILRATLLLESLGAVVMALRFIPLFGFVKGVWFSVFHAVSAFCNAGFDLMGGAAPYSSLTAFAGDPLVNLPIMALITVGGIGFFVWGDIREHGFRFHAYRLQTKMVLTVSLALILLPAAYFYFYEFSQPQWAGMTGGERVWAALFQSVTPRTAGFNTVELTRYESPSVLVTILLMLVGGSSGSTAGGVKTTSLLLLFLCVRSSVQNRDSVQAFRRRLPPEVIRNTITILTLYVLLFLTGGTLISCIEGVSLSAALFESASAIGTVGLSLGMTGGLGPASRLILILLMYFGRVGGLTMLYAVASRRPPALSRLPQEKIAVG